jgi:hypothetical protein
MAKRQSLGRGLGALIPDVSRETTTAKPKSGTGAKPAEKVSSSAPKKAAPATKSTAKPAAKTATKATVPAGQTQAPAAIAGLTFAELPVRSIVPNAQQPRHIEFTNKEIDPEYLAIAHRALLRARSRAQLTKLLLSADKAKLVAGAPKISEWHLATWAKDRTDIWRP